MSPISLLEELLVEVRSAGTSRPTLIIQFYEVLAFTEAVKAALGVKLSGPIGRHALVTAMVEATHTFALRIREEIKPDPSLIHRELPDQQN